MRCAARGVGAWTWAWTATHQAMRPVRAPALPGMAAMHAKAAIDSATGHLTMLYEVRGTLRRGCALNGWGGGRGGGHHRRVGWARSCCRWLPAVAASHLASTLPSAQCSRPTWWHPLSGRWRLAVRCVEARLHPCTSAHPSPTLCACARRAGAWTPSFVSSCSCRRPLAATPTRGAPRGWPPLRELSLRDLTLPPSASPPSPPL